MGYHWLIPLIAAAANVAICILVLRLGMRERLHRGFAAIVFGRGFRLRMLAM